MNARKGRGNNLMNKRIGIIFIIFFGDYLKTHTFAPIILKKQNQMKKVLSFFAVASLAVATVACGPSKAEIEAKEKAKQDSLNEVMKADSVAKAAQAEMEAKAAQAKADSLAQVAKADSLAKAEEAAKGKKGGKK